LPVQVTHAWQKLPTDRLDIDFIERRRVGLEVCFHSSRFIRIGMSRMW